MDMSGDPFTDHFDNFTSDVHLGDVILKEPMDFLSHNDENIDLLDTLQLLENENAFCTPIDYDMKICLPDLGTELSDCSEYNTNCTINPDDFLNDICKDEIKSEPRSTPSPTMSSGSSDYSMDSITTNKTSEASGSSSPYQQYNVLISNGIDLCNKYTIDTPPTSPPTQDSPGHLGQSILITPTPATTTNNPIQIMGGTLIPITTIPITAPVTSSNLQPKQIKIQPKINEGGTKTTTSFKSATGNKKLILSASDYRSLLEKCKSQNGKGPSIIIKTAKSQPIDINNISNKSMVDLNGIAVKNINVPSTSPPKSINCKPIGVKTVLPKEPTVPLVSSHQTTDFFVRKDMDERAIKKQQRMIKNRESACLSRKKKKEYVTSLEKQVSDLSKEVADLKKENKNLKQRLANFSNVCMNCHKAGQSFLKSALGTSVRKNTAVFLAVLFMVSINMGPFGSLLSSRTDTISPEPVHHSRGILWVDEVPDINGSNTDYGEYQFGTDTIDSTGKYPICPAANQTESIRLAGELRRWIGARPDYFNLSKSFETDFILKDNLQLSDGTKLVNNIGEANSGTRKMVKNYRLSKRLSSAPNESKYKNEVEIYDQDINSRKYRKFFEEIGKRDDTFYIVSLGGDQLLLPALAHNKTFRPKMSLMLPAMGTNNSFQPGVIAIMQIDCEVVNTTLLHVSEKSIPDKLLFANNNGKSEEKSKTTSNQNPVTTDSKSDTINTINKNFIQDKPIPLTLRGQYKPYFIDKNHGVMGPN